MRLLATADLHYNHPRSRRLADELIDRMLGVEADALLLVGDTAASADDHLERCLRRFEGFAGPKLFVAGNHELWTDSGDSYRLFTEDLPRRIAAAGWRWLQTEPLVLDDWAIVGSIGWYDYSFASEELGIPRRFYEHKAAPGTAAASGSMDHLFHTSQDIPPHAAEVYARWNDGRFVHLHRSDEQFVTELTEQLDRQLAAHAEAGNVLVAMHHVPFHEMLPPPHNAQWDFAKAFLGSQRFGETILKHRKVRMVICGHTHLPLDVHVGHIHAMNIGSGYRQKRYRVLELG